MKITLIISKMSNSGGTERVMSILTSELVKRNYIITIIAASDSIKETFYPLDPRVNLIKANILGRIRNPLLKLLYFPFAILKLRKAVLSTKPDIVISFVDILNIMSIISLYKTNIPVIVTEHFALGVKKIGFIWEFLRKQTYIHTKAIAVITPQDKIFFPASLQDKISVVYNPVIKSGLVKTNYIDLNYELISAGRLVSGKGFDILIRTFSKIENSFPTLKLNIYGSGPELKNLNSLIGSLRLENKVFIHQPVDNIIEKMVKSDIFVLASKSESFGMVIAEAMSAGVPVISTDCPNGPGNIIQNKINGILVQNENADEISENIKLLLQDANLRKVIGTNALMITEKFSIDKFMKSWDEILAIK